MAFDIDLYLQDNSAMALQKKKNLPCPQIYINAHMTSR